MMTAVLFNFSFSWPISFGSSSTPKPPSNKTIYGLVQRLGPGQIKNLCTNIKIGKKFFVATAAAAAAWHQKMLSTFIITFYVLPATTTTLTLN